MITQEYIEQTSGKKLPIIFGEKVVLVPFLDIFDMDDFIRLHREDRRGHMCRFCLKNLNESEAEDYVKNLINNNDIYVWSVSLKGQTDKKAGFIYLSNVTSHSASINGIMDKRFVKSLTKEERRDKKNFSDDATVTLMNACFENGFQRIEGDAVEDDREAVALHKRIGFKQEGLLRKAVNVNGNLKNLIIVSILKEEWKNG